MEVKAIQTDLFSEGENLRSFLQSHLKDFPMEERGVLVVSSKVVSLAEGRVVKKSEAPRREALVRSEADRFLAVGPHSTHLCIKHGQLVPGAGIDESNSRDSDYILYPRDPFASARVIWEWLGQDFSLRQRGVILSDSHSVPLRLGVVGFALAHWGFAGLSDQRGREDLFGRALRLTRVNQVDPLACAANLLMGEAGQCRPLAWIQGAPVEFCEDRWDFAEDLFVAPKEDLFAPLFADLEVKDKKL